MNKVKIDYIKDFELDLDNKPIENLHALDYLKVGIIALVNDVLEREKKIKEAPMGSASFYSSFSGEDSNLLACVFQWFTISVINYVRTVALVNLMNEKCWKLSDINNNKKEIKKCCTDYVKEVVPELYNWRNKVAAHFAITGPQDENIGMLEFSLFNPISFSSPHYYVGNFNWSSCGEESNMDKWSLIEIFEKKLVPRYWPEMKKNI